MVKLNHSYNSFHMPQPIIFMTLFEQGSQITVFLEKILVKQRINHCRTRLRKINLNLSLTCNTLACEKNRFSSLFAAGTFHAEERLRLSNRNSILMMQINVYIMNPVVMGFQI